VEAIVLSSVTVATANRAHEQALFEVFLGKAGSIVQSVCRTACSKTARAIAPYLLLAAASSGW
jgi:hypothetical protein